MAERPNSSQICDDSPVTQPDKRARPPKFEAKALRSWRGLPSVGLGVDHTSANSDQVH